MPRDLHDLRQHDHSVHILQARASPEPGQYLPRQLSEQWPDSSRRHLPGVPGAVRKLRRGDRHLHNMHRRLDALQ